MFVHCIVLSHQTSACNLNDIQENDEFVLEVSDIFNLSHVEMSICCT